MDATPTLRLSDPELDALLREADPAALLLPPRLMRRVMVRNQENRRLGLRRPHDQVEVLSREELLQVVGPQELGRPTDALPEHVLLLVRPRPGELEESPAALLLWRYWRLLFHARIRLALEQKVRAGELPPHVVRSRIRDLGQFAFHEARDVLAQDHRIDASSPDTDAYIAFAALYLELRHFDTGLLGITFPGIKNQAQVDEVLARDVDAASVLEATRLPGAEPWAEELTAQEPAAEEAPSDAGATAEPVSCSYQTLVAQGLRRAARGNEVRSAILQTQAARIAPPALRARAETGARVAIHRLVDRLQQALQLSPDTARLWRTALPQLLPAASRGIWPVEARLLYDLQRVCLDFERGVHRIDVMEWLLTFGHRPMHRTLPLQRDVAMCRHLRTASQRVGAVRLPEADRTHLARLLHEAQRQWEHRLTDHLRGLIDGALEDEALRPANLPERLARDKLVAELADRAVERGYLTLGDLRDAVSRNQLKLPDLAGPSEFFARDPLLRLDWRFADALDGVYHRGEIYLRWMQRLSSLAFGTQVGRWLTAYVLIPYGAAFVTIEFLTHLVHKIQGFASGEEHHEPPPGADGLYPVLLRVLLLGTFLFALIHFPAVRQGFAWSFRKLYRGVRFLFFEGPARLLTLPSVRALLSSLPVRLLYRFAIRPLPPALLVGVILLMLDVRFQVVWSCGVMTFCALAVFLNTPWGRDAEEMVQDWMMLSWQRFWLDFLPGLYRILVDVFRTFLAYIDRVLYTVDEWLRFNQGEGAIVGATKAVLGVVWFVVSYFVRFCVLLLIEPQINPLKHFPWVTVGHKVMLPTIPLVGNTLALAMNSELAYAVATVIIFGCPGIFGFLVWELKENWRLYRANRPATLPPEVIGHHGETMVRLLQPGFHSGTVPRIFARLRRIAHDVPPPDRPQRTHRARESLHHVVTALRHFVERELVAYLHASRAWQGEHVSIHAVEEGSNFLRVGLARSASPGEVFWFQFEEQEGWLLASVHGLGWLPSLREAQRRTLRTGLIGLYKRANVQLTREQLAAALVPPIVDHDLNESGLLVWVRREADHAAATYSLRPGRDPYPQATDVPVPETLPPILPEKVLLRQARVEWDAWVAVWEEDSPARHAAFLEGFIVLPEEKSRSLEAAS